MTSMLRKDVVSNGNIQICIWNMTFDGDFSHYCVKAFDKKLDVCIHYSKHGFREDAFEQYHLILNEHKKKCCCRCKK